MAARRVHLPIDLRNSRDLLSEEGVGAQPQRQTSRVWLGRVLSVAAPESDQWDLNPVCTPLTCVVPGQAPIRASASPSVGCTLSKGPPALPRKLENTPP